MGPEGVFYYCSFVCALEKRPQLPPSPAAAFGQTAGPAQPQPAAAGAARPGLSAAAARSRSGQAFPVDNGTPTLPGGAARTVRLLPCDDDLGASKPWGRQRGGPRRTAWSSLFSEARSFPHRSREPSRPAAWQSTPGRAALPVQHLH